MSSSNAQALSIRDFLDSLVAKTGHFFSSEQFLKIKIAGIVIEIRCDSTQLMQVARESFKKFIVDDSCVPQTTILCWQDQLANYIPYLQDHYCWLYDKQRSQGILYVNRYWGFMACDFMRDTYYYCYNDTGIPWEDSCGAHFLYRLFFQWGLNHRLYLLHAASMGTRSKGVLIAGKNGAGKSTLAISGLMDGFEYVSDDYVLLSMDKPAKAYPLYSIAIATPEIYKRVKPPFPVNRELITGKVSLDISHAAGFVDTLSVDALILPEICHATHPKIDQCPVNEAIVPVVQTTLNQVEMTQAPYLAKGIYETLRDLPSFKMQLADDPFKNLAVIRDFLSGISE